MTFVAQLRRARAPLAAFVALGIYWGAWSAVVPAVRAAVAVDDAQLGRALLCVALGAVPAMMVGGRLVDRHGGRHLLALAIGAFGPAAPLSGLAGTPVILAAALLVVGAASGLMDTVMNARVSALEAVHGIRLMHLAHGTFALTFFLAATLAGWGRELGASHSLLLATAAALILASAMVAGSERTPPADEVRGYHRRRRGRRLPPAVILLGLMTMLAFLAENGLQSWSALHLESDLGAGAAIGGIGPGFLELTVAGGRFAGQALAGRLGEGTMLVAASLLGSAGAALFALAAAPPAALVGLAVAGAGLSVIAPTAFGLAGRTVPPERRGSAISATGIIGYTGFFIGPAVLGLMSSSFGLRAALLTIAGLIGVVPLLWLAVAAQRSP